MATREFWTRKHAEAQMRGYMDLFLDVTTWTFVAKGTVNIAWGFSLFV